MVEDLLVIENGKMRRDGREIFRQLQLTIYQAEILGILFGNILEQKNFILLLLGEVSLDSGKIRFERDRIGLKTSGLFQKHVSVVDRNCKLIDSLSISANVLLFAPFMKRYTVNDKRYDLHLRKLAKQFQVDIPLDAPVTSLTTRERIVVELLKAYVEQKKLVVLEGVLDSLNYDDAQAVLSVIFRLKHVGMTFLILESVENLLLDWIDRLVVIRNGKTQWIFASGDANRQQIYTALLGEKRSKGQSKRIQTSFSLAEGRYPALRFKRVSTEILRNINFTVEKGEILRICFLDEPSFNHFVEILKGYRRPLTGQISIIHKPYSIQHSHQSVDKGLCFIEEAPYETMAIHGMTILDHICLPLSKKIPRLWMKRRFVQHIRKQINDLLGGDYADTYPQKQSSVNMLRIAYLKWLIYNPAVVICVKPFAELNFHLRRATEEMIEMLSDRGIAVVILTLNLAESTKSDAGTIYIRNGEILDAGEIDEYLYGDNGSADRKTD